MTCTHCGAEVDGLALCELCRAGLLIRLRLVPIYFTNLSRWRPASTGTRGVPGSREPRGVTPPREHPAQALLDTVHTDITTWVRALVDDRPFLSEGLSVCTEADSEAATVRACCAFLADAVPTMLTLGWVGEMLRQLGEHEQRLRIYTERVAPGWYAGACHRCEASTHVVPGLTWVTCGTCGVTTHVADHLDVILTEARDWVAPPRQIAEALVALTATEASVTRLHDRIRQWSTRDRLDVVQGVDQDGAPVGLKRYQLGQVLDLLRAEGQTRTTRPVAAAS